MGRISRMAMLRRGARAVTPSPRPVRRPTRRVVRRSPPARGTPSTTPRIMRRFIGEKKAAMGPPIKLYEVEEVYPSGLMPVKEIIEPGPPSRATAGTLWSPFLREKTRELEAKARAHEQAIRGRERIFMSYFSK